MIKLEDVQFIKSKYIVLTEHVSEAKIDFLINQNINALTNGIKEIVKALHFTSETALNLGTINNANKLIQYINSEKVQVEVRNQIQQLQNLKPKLLAVDKTLPKHKRFHFNFNANLNAFFDAYVKASFATLLDLPRLIHSTLLRSSAYNTDLIQNALSKSHTRLYFLLEDFPNFIETLQLWDIAKQSKLFTDSLLEFDLIDQPLFGQITGLFEEDTELDSNPIKVQLESWVQDLSDVKYETLAEAGNYTVVKPLNKLAYLKLGYGTQWCTSIPNFTSGILGSRNINTKVPIEDIKNQIVERTVNYPNAIIILKNNKPFIQLDKDSDQLMDVNDKSLGSFTFETDSDLMDPLLGSLLPTLRQVGHALIPKINGLQNINPGNIDPDDEYEFVNPITNYMITSSAFKLAIFKAALNLNTTKAYVYITSNSEIFKDPNLASVLRAINIVPVDMTKITVARILETIKNNPNLFNQYNKIYSNHQYTDL